MARAKSGGRSCGRPEALARLDQARKFIEAAELVVGEQDEFSGVAAALAVLGGIAASDAACCARLRERHRGPDHAGAAALLETVEPGGVKMSKDLRRLLAAKDDAHYGVIGVSQGAEQRLVAQARRLFNLAELAVEV